MHEESDIQGAIKRRHTNVNERKRVRQPRRHADANKTHSPLALSMPSFTAPFVLGSVSSLMLSPDSDCARHHMRTGLEKTKGKRLINKKQKTRDKVSLKQKTAMEQKRHEWSYFSVSCKVASDE